MRRPVLLLNNGFMPINICSARRALCMVTTGKAVVVRHTDRQICRGVYLPSVVRLVEFARIPYRPVKVTRKTIIMRDGGKCMYCGQKPDKGYLQMEHVFPKSRGGKATWDNLVAACEPCNRKKGNRTPEEAGMKLIHKPLPMTVHTSRYIMRQIGSEFEDWDEFLFRDSKGDERFVAHA